MTKIFLLFLISQLSFPGFLIAQTLPVVGIGEVAGSSTDYLKVLKCTDFTVTGRGDNAEWSKAVWNNLSKLDTGGRSYESRFKILYSATGLYLLFSGEDDKITTTNYKDFEDIYNGDVFEAFFLPNRKAPVYFEYEINQLSREIILTLSKVNNQLYSWSPRYPAAEDKKPVKKQVTVVGENVEVGSVIKSWIAEVFIPYTILGLLPGVPPAAGTTWYANFCRIDYDSGKMIKYSWTPTIAKSFHEIEKFQ
ncbi:MAG: carbohydrate-binding family 9-like protein, partial [Segetibacter sp.]